MCQTWHRLHTQIYSPAKLSLVSVSAEVWNSCLLLLTSMIRSLRYYNLFGQCNSGTVLDYSLYSSACMMQLIVLLCVLTMYVSALCIPISTAGRESPP